MAPNDRSNVERWDEDADVANEYDTPGEEYEHGVAENPSERAESWWEGGLATLLLVAGVLLFLFPEPATSGLGVLLILAGAVVWLIDWAT